MTYNIAAGHGDLNAVTAVIRAAAPKVVALQEVDVHWAARSKFADQAAELGGALDLRGRFAHIYDLPPTAAGVPRREYGVALLSRFDILEFANRALTRHSTQDENAPPSPMPGFLAASIDVDGVRVRVFNTHLDYRQDPAVRRQQVAEMLALIGDSGRPTLLFGDLNAPPTAPELRPLLARLRDSWPAGGDSGLTYPSDQPVKRIDYVLASSHFRVVRASVLSTQASDHRPVVVDLELRP